MPTMSPNRGIIVFIASGLLIAGISVVAVAEEGSNLRQAGSDDRFRVIDRFSEPDTQPEQSSTEMPTVEESSPFYPAVQSVKDERWSLALDLLSHSSLAEELAQQPSKQFLAGYVALQSGDTSTALEYFDAIDEGRLSALSDYRAYYAARAALELDDAHRATLEASKVSDDSRLYEDALYVLAQALAKAGERQDVERAIEVSELFLSQYGSGNDGPRVSLLLGELLESVDRHNDAARTYLELRDNRPLRSEAREAEERLERLRDRIDDGLAAQIDAESDERTIRRYVGLYNLHRSERVIDELSPRIDDFAANSDERCTALFKVAHSYTKLRRHGDGTPWYDRVLNECAGTSYEIRALYLGGRGRWNAGDRQGAMDIFEQIWTKFPEHSFSDDAMYFTGRILRSEDRPEEARQILKRQVEIYPDGDMAKDAHWLLVRQHFEDEEYQKAIEYIDGLESTGEDDLYTRGRLHYFRGRALELSGETERARQALQEMTRQYPKTYYALLAFNRLAELAGGDSDDVCAAARDICDELLPPPSHVEAIDVPDRLRRDAAFDRGTQLLALGLSSHARGEFSDLRSRHAGDPSTLWALASLLDSTGAYPLSHNIARRHIDGWMNEYPSPSTRQKWEVAYPNPFREEVERWAGERDLDAAKIYAIMREESGFNPRIESWANARGLLQLLDDTAERMANRDNLSPYSFDRLDEPDINVRLGSAYMEFLGERFDNHPTLISAGYNGGSGNVARWLGEFGDLPLDLFVEDIPFHQTRNYAKRVMMSYWIYSYLYGDQRVPRLAFELPSN